MWGDREVHCDRTWHLLGVSWKCIAGLSKEAPPSDLSFSGLLIAAVLRVGCGEARLHRGRGTSNTARGEG